MKSVTFKAYILTQETNRYWCKAKCARFQASSLLPASLYMCFHSPFGGSSQLRDLKTVLDAILTFKASSDGHISTQRRQSMHIEVSILPPFLSYTSLTWTGQTLLQMPHFVHFSSSLFR